MSHRPTCHMIDPAAAKRQGPNLYGVLQRMPGALMSLYKQKDAGKRNLIIEYLAATGGN